MSSEQNENPPPNPPEDETPKVDVKAARKLFWALLAAITFVSSVGIALGVMIWQAGNSEQTAAGPAAPHLEPPFTLSGMEVYKVRPEAPQAVFRRHNSEQTQLSDYLGEVVVLNLWATWCPPCIKEMPALDNLAKAVQGDPIRVIALSTDRGGAPVARKFLRQANLENLDLYTDRTGAVPSALGLRSLPVTIIIDRQGKIVGRLIGIAEWDDPEVVAYLQALAVGGPA